MQNIIYILTVLMLIKIAYTDYKQKIIPDRLNLVIALLGIINLIINFENCKVYIASATTTFAVFLFLAAITDGGVGGGDIKLFTVLGLIFGPSILEVVLVTFVLAAFISISMVILKRKGRKEEIALAPYICVSAIILVIYLFFDIPYIFI